MVNNSREQFSNITQDILDIVIAENPNLLMESVDKILSNKQPWQDTIFVCDVDECITCGHLSKTLSDGMDIISGRERPNVPDDSLESLTMLWDNYIGINRMQYLTMMANAADHVPLKQSFIQISNRYLKNTKIFPVMISGGVDGMFQILSQRNCLNFINILACRPKFDENNRIERPGLVIGEKEKGLAVKLLVESGGFKNVISLGHSYGDVSLISSGTQGNRFWLRDYRYPDTERYSDTTLENLYELEKHLVPFTAISEGISNPFDIISVLKNQRLIPQNTTESISMVSKVKLNKLNPFFYKSLNGRIIGKRYYFIHTQDERLYALPKTRPIYNGNNKCRISLEEQVQIIHPEIFGIQSIVEYTYDRYKKPHNHLRMYV